MRTIVCGLVWICASLGTSSLWAQGQGQARSPTSTSCTAAKRLSVVRAWSTDRINVAENIPQQECRFTVNDAPAGGGAQDAAQTLKAWESLLRPPVAAAGSFPSELGFVLGSAAPGDTAAALKPVLEKNGVQLRTCFAARASREPFQLSSADVVCVSSREGFKGVVRVEGSMGVEFETAAPHLRFGVRGATTAHYLFIPGA